MIQTAVRKALFTGYDQPFRWLFLDTETRNLVDINEGNDKYTRAAECLIVTYAFEAGPAKIWLPFQDPAIPADLKDALEDEACAIVAHNAAFDRLILLRALGIRTKLERWRCAMAQGAAHGLPGSLEMLGIVCGLSEDQQKLVDDKKLIHTFCIPQANGQFIQPWDQPDAWQRFCRYAIRDTETLREIHKRLPMTNYQGHNLNLWFLDQLINERGFGFDEPLADAAIEFLKDAKGTSDAEVERLTDGEVHAATQRNRLLNYFRRVCGIDIESLRASEVQEWLEHDDLEPTVRMLLEQRLEAGKSSGSKYKRGRVLVGPRSRIRHWCRFSGAGRTGRHSGRGFQPHNLARPTIRVRRANGRIELEPIKASYIDDVIIPGIYNHQALNNPWVYGGPNEAAALALRHVITAAPGNELVTGDFKNVESVITAWIAGETIQINSFMDAFANPKDKSKDVYRILAGKILGKPPELVTDTERQMGKVAILAFGFGGGVSALVNMAAAYQLDLDPIADIILPTATLEQLQKAEKAWRRAFLMGEDFELSARVYMACDVLKQSYRTANNAIDQLRKDVDMAVKNAVRHPNEQVFNVGRCKICCVGTYLIIELPSGRRLLYASPKLHTEEVKDPEGGKPWTTSYITYSTARGRGWRREKAWSGLFVENMVQAIANDVLRAAMWRVHLDTLTVPVIRDYLMTLPEEERTAISLHVHDEIVLDVPIGSYPISRLREQLVKLEPWMEGLPMSADLWNFPRYGKR